MLGAVILLLFVILKSLKSKTFRNEEHTAHACFEGGVYFH